MALDLLISLIQKENMQFIFHSHNIGVPLGLAMLDAKQLLEKLNGLKLESWE